MAQLARNSAAMEALCRIPWQAFITLSFPDIRPGVMVGPYIRERMLFAWLRRVGHAGGKSRGDALSYFWAVRPETGEKTGRFHYHPLIGGLGSAFVHNCILVPRPAVGGWWEDLGGGNVRTSRVCDRLGVVAYFEKAAEAGFEYEAGRFTTNSSILSEYAVGRLTRYARRRAGAQHHTNAGETGFVKVERVTRAG